jgi:hypothetical protein
LPNLEPLRVLSKTLLEGSLFLFQALPRSFRAHPASSVRALFYPRSARLRSM